MTGMANAAAMHQMVQRDMANFRPNYQNNALNYGAKAGYLNRQEYVSLGNYANETARLREKWGKGGLNSFERAALSARQKNYDKMYQRYSFGDYHPRTTARDGIHARQLNQLNRTYGGVRNGSITMGEGNYLLNQNRGVSRQRGRYERYGNPWTGRLNGGERRALHSRLNFNSRNINRMKNNWVSDFRPPWMRFF